MDSCSVGFAQFCHCFRSADWVYAIVCRAITSLPCHYSSIVTFVLIAYICVLWSSQLISNNNKKNGIFWFIIIVFHLMFNVYLFCSYARILSLSLSIFLKFSIVPGCLLREWSAHAHAYAHAHSLASYSFSSLYENKPKSDTQFLWIL